MAMMFFPVQVIEALGEPITGHGEMSGRGRRREIA